MKDDCDCGCCGSVPRMAVRAVVGVIAAIVVLTVIVAVLRGTFGLAATGEFLPGWLWAIIGIVVAVWLLSWLFRIVFMPWRRHGRDWGWKLDGAREMRIIRRRYARGDITEAQFKRMMKNLKDE